jgi:hypothetical protein
METINDIVSDMRKRFEPYAKSDSNDARYVAYLGYAEFADRIEKAAKALEDDRDNWRKQALAEDERANATQSMTKCNGFKLRKAIEQIREELLRDSGCGPATEFHIAVDKITQEALAAPARNCDRFNNADEVVEYYGDEAIKEAWKKLREDIKDGKYEFAVDLVFMIDWLFAEAKGETK